MRIIAIMCITSLVNAICLSEAFAVERDGAASLERHIELFNEHMQLLKCGAFNVTILDASKPGDGKSVVMDGTYHFDWAGDRARLDQLARKDRKTVWSRDTDKQYVFHARNPSSPVLIYPRNKVIQIDGLWMPFDFRQLPILSCRNIQVGKVVQHASPDPELMLDGFTITNVRRLEGQMEGTLEVGLQSLKEVAEKYDEPIRSQLRAVISDPNIAPEDLPILRLRRIVRFDTAAPGHLSTAAHPT